MKLINCIVLAAFFLSVSADSSEENSNKNDTNVEIDEIFLLKVLMELGWQFDKVDLISSSVSDIISDYNATVVAYQNIYDAEGNLKEIKTLELVVPKMVMDKKTNKFVKLMPKPSDSDDGQDIYEEVAELRKAFHILSRMGMPMQMSVEEYDRDAQLKTEGYLDEDDVYIYRAKMAYLNRTVYVDNKKVVEDFIKANDVPGALPLAVLHYDVDGKFVEEGSRIFEPVMTRIEDLKGFNTTVIRDILKGFTITSLKHPEDLPKHLTEYLKKLYPEMKWVILGNSISYFYYLDYNYIMLRNELADLDVECTPYMVVGIEKK